MKSVTEIRSLADMRTNITTHSRSAPRRKGTAYLEVYLLDRERQRLETELAMLSKRRARVEPRLVGIQAEVQRLVRRTQGEETARLDQPAPSTTQLPPAEPRGVKGRGWIRMPVEY